MPITFTLKELKEVLDQAGLRLVPVPPFTRWSELEEALAARKLKLVDISRDSKIDTCRTKYSIQYLSDLRSGRYVTGPNEAVLAEVARAIGCPVDELRPGRNADEPEALAS